MRSITGYVNVLMEDYGSRLDEEGRGHLQALDPRRQPDGLPDPRFAGLRPRRPRGGRSWSRCAFSRCWRKLFRRITAHTANRRSITIQAGQFEVLAHRFLLEQCVGKPPEQRHQICPARRPRPKSRIRAEARPGRVRLWVEDNGIGIDPSYHGKIFSIFERVGDLQKYEGTGIGLAIVHRAVQRMGGACGVISAPGEGSRFWVDFLAAPSANGPPDGASGAV